MIRVIRLKEKDGNMNDKTTTGARFNNDDVSNDHERLREHRETMYEALSDKAIDVLDKLGVQHASDLLTMGNNLTNGKLSTAGGTPMVIREIRRLQEALGVPHKGWTKARRDEARARGLKNAQSLKKAREVRSENVAKAQQSPDVLVGTAMALIKQSDVQARLPILTEDDLQARLAEIRKGRIDVQARIKELNSLLIVFDGAEQETERWLAALAQKRAVGAADVAAEST